MLRALLAGILVVLVSGPLGCVVVWRRMAYFGDALAHGALLGAGLALAFDFNAPLSREKISTPPRLVVSRANPL